MAALIASPLAAEEISGAAGWSGLPSALSILGTALGTSLLATIMQRRGRRRGLVTGYSVAAAGAMVATVAVVRHSLVLLLVAMSMIGFGRSCDALSRYFVADLYSIGRRASAIGWVVWVGTVGAILGPNALEPAGITAVRLGLPRLAGAYLVALVAYGATLTLYLSLMRPDPAALVQDEGDSVGLAPEVPISTLFRTGSVRVAMAILVSGQTAMVLIMTMTPLYLRRHGHALAEVGLVMSAHIVGMYVLSPLTGRLVDSWGRIPVIVTGQLTLLTAALAAWMAPPSEVGLVALALFLLGLGWNQGFVAGSALLSSGLSIDQRSRIQGVTDSFIWFSAALASALSGVILAASGYRTLCLLAAVLLVIPATVLVRYRESIARAVPHSAS